MDCKHPTDKLMGYDKGVVCRLCGKTFTAKAYNEMRPEKPAAKPTPRKRAKKEA